MNNKKKNVVTILIMCIIIIIFFLFCFPFINKIKLQKMCNKYGSEYKIQKNEGKYPTLYRWICIDSNGKAINPEDGNEVPDHWFGSD